MALKDITDRKAVLKAIAEYDKFGQTEFLKRYGFGKSRAYVLVHEGRQYDSKAIAGVAHRYQFPKKGPLEPRRFHQGGKPVQELLESLGFEVRILDSEKTESRGESADEGEYESHEPPFGVPPLPVRPCLAVLEEPSHTSLVYDKGPVYYYRDEDGGHLTATVMVEDSSSNCTFIRVVFGWDGGKWVLNGAWVQADE